MTKLCLCPARTGGSRTGRAKNDGARRGWRQQRHGWGGRRLEGNARTRKGVVSAPAPRWTVQPTRRSDWRYATTKVTTTGVPPQLLHQSSGGDIDGVRRGVAAGRYAEVNRRLDGTLRKGGGATTVTMSYTTTFGTLTPGKTALAATSPVVIDLVPFVAPTHGATRSTTHVLPKACASRPGGSPKRPGGCCWNH